MGSHCVHCDAFEEETIQAISSTTFVATIGPSAMDRGYGSITGNKYKVIGKQENK